MLTSAKMYRPRIKICGITQPEDALAAVAAGADAIGLVFYPPSCRYVSMEQARQIAALIPPFITLTGLFVDHDIAHIAAIHQQLRLSLLQFHGNESPAFCASVSHQLGLPFIRAIPVDSTDTIEQACVAYSAAQGLLLDHHDAHQSGGTGRTFDWSMIPESPTKPLILAGGLHTGNVMQALRQVQPYAIDVSSGVEQTRGVKSTAKIQAFIAQVYRHTCHQMPLP